MNREKSNLTTGILLRNPRILAHLRSHGNGEGRGGRALLGGWPVTRYSAFDGSHCGGDIFSRGPGPHSFDGGSLELG
jgi:hypothetical protein